MLATTKNIPTSQRQWLVDLLVLTILLAGFFALWLGSHALLVPDESRYSTIAWEMVTSGNYITPHLNGVSFLDKPILYYWLQASAIKVFGLNEWSLRFWPALCGVLGCIFTYVAGRLLFDRRTGIIASIILATSPLYFFMAHYANLDLEVAVFISGALFAFLIAVNYLNTTKGQIFLWLAYLFVALACLTKGMIGVVLPALVIGVGIILLNRWMLLKQVHLVRGLLLVLIIAAPWYILAQKANPEFWHYFFVTQQFSRFVSTGFNDQESVWFYFPVVLLGIIPWLLFLCQALTHAVKTVWQNRLQHQTELYLLLWPLLIFTFFSIPASKTIGYILPVVPPLALLIGSYLSKQWDKAQQLTTRIGLIVFIVFALVLTVGLWFSLHIAALQVVPSLVPYLRAMAVVFFLAAVAALFTWRATKLIALFSVLVATNILACLIFLAATPYADFPSTKPQALVIKQYLKPSDKVVTYYQYYQDLPIYTQHRITIVADWNDPGVINGDNWRHQLSDGMHSPSYRQWLIGPATFWRQWHSQQRIFVLVDVKYRDDFKKQAGSKFYQLMDYQDVLLITNQNPASVQ